MQRQDLYDRLKAIYEAVSRVMCVIPTRGNYPLFVTEAEAIAALALITEAEEKVTNLGNDLAVEAREEF